MKDVTPTGAPVRKRARRQRLGYNRRRCNRDSGLEPLLESPERNPDLSAQKRQQHRFNVQPAFPFRFRNIEVMLVAPAPEAIPQVCEAIYTGLRHR